MFDLKISQAQIVTFPMIDSNGTEVTGLVDSFGLFISKAGGLFAASAGAKAEIGSGWYSYELTAGETDTAGPLAITVTGAGCLQQNLEYVVLDRSINAVTFTYTVTDSVTTLPVEGVLVWCTIDGSGNTTIWKGVTDAFGVARDSNGAVPRLDAGPYFFWCEKSGFTFSNPDQEDVS